MARGRFDWPKVLAKLRNDEWYLLGTALPKTTYEAIRAGNIKAMQGVEVRMRNQTRNADGKRFGDIYLRRRDDGNT